MPHDTESQTQRQDSADSVAQHTVLERLQVHREELEGMGVRFLAIFGSVARDEAGPDSDIDILVDLERPTGLFKSGHVHNYLVAALGREVDVVPRDRVRPQLEGRIIQETLRIL